MSTQSSALAQSSPATVSALLTLRNRFRVVRAATLAFTAPLSPEDQMVQSSPDASPVKWHLAHTSWFFESFVLSPYAPGYQAFHPDFHWLFNSYYNALGDMPAKKLRASFSRPPLAQIEAYRQYVDEAIERLLTDAPEATAAEIARRVALGLEHEQQHLELAATDVKHALFTNPLHPAYREGAEANADAPASPTAPLSFTQFAGGLVEIGVSPDAEDPLVFAFDNETPRHQVFLQPFALADRLVTVAEYLQFMAADGYSRAELWLSEGWSTVRAEGWQAPLYWERDAAAGSGWKIFTLEGFHALGGLEDPMTASPVCHLSLFEADAFARWVGARLPTEFEWEHAATSACANRRDANLLESGRLHPVPAPAAAGLLQCFGDVWEWTSSGYTGYPGYQPLPGALGEYNGKFMSSQVILRGGSCVTPSSHIRETYRNFFPPATRWQFSGVRLAKNVAGPAGTATEAR